jgi:hypothetical protein
MPQGVSPSTETPEKDEQPATPSPNKALAVEIQKKATRDK